MNNLESVLAEFGVNDFRIVGNKVMLINYSGNKISNDLLKQMQSLPVRYYFNEGIGGNVIPTNTEFVKGNLSLVVRKNLNFKSLSCSDFRVDGKGEYTLEITKGKFSNVFMDEVSLMNSTLLSSDVFITFCKVINSRIESLGNISLSLDTIVSTHLESEATTVLKNSEIRESYVSSKNLNVFQPTGLVELTFSGQAFLLNSGYYASNVEVNLNLLATHSVALEGLMKGEVHFVNVPDVRIDISTLFSEVSDLHLSGDIGTLGVRLERSKVSAKDNYSLMKYSYDLSEKIRSKYSKLTFSRLLHYYH